MLFHIRPAPAPHMFFIFIQTIILDDTKPTRVTQLKFHQKGEDQLDNHKILGYKKDGN